MVGAWFSSPHEVQCVMGEDKQVVGRGWVCVGPDERERGAEPNAHLSTPSSRVSVPVSVAHGVRRWWWWWWRRQGRRFSSMSTLH